MGSERPPHVAPGAKSIAWTARALARHASHEPTHPHIAARALPPFALARLLPARRLDDAPRPAAAHHDDRRRHSETAAARRAGVPGVMCRCWGGGRTRAAQNRRCASRAGAPALRSHAATAQPTPLPARPRARPRFRRRRLLGRLRDQTTPQPSPGPPSRRGDIQRRRCMRDDRCIAPASAKAPACAASPCGGAAAPADAGRSATGPARFVRGMVYTGSKPAMYRVDEPLPRFPGQPELAARGTTRPFTASTVTPATSPPPCYPAGAPGGARARARLRFERCSMHEHSIPCARLAGVPTGRATIIENMLDTRRARRHRPAWRRPLAGRRAFLRSAPSPKPLFSPKGHRAESSRSTVYADHRRLAVLVMIVPARARPPCLTRPWSCLALCWLQSSTIGFSAGR